MLNQLEKLEKRYQEIEELLGSQDVASDKGQYQKLAKELSDLQKPVSLFREYKKISLELTDLEHALKEKHDKDFVELAELELAELAKSIADPPPVVIITGYDSPASQDRVLAAGAVAYLRKPINDQALLDVIAHSYIEN